MPNASGTLYIVATPIGNLGDMSPRAVDALRAADVIAAEDTRHSTPLLRHFGVSTPCVAYHEHNESVMAERLVRRLAAGETVALISDAGTPLISDPGYRLVQAARAAGAAVSPVPGPNAAIAALSASGLATDRFVFEGFLPAKAGERQRRLQELRQETRTLVFYESSHRIEQALADMAAVFGGDRPATVAREITKRYETFYHQGLGALAEHFAAAQEERRGEFVVMVVGAEPEQVESAGAADLDTLLGTLLKELPLKQAVSIATQACAVSRNVVYRRALQLVGEK